MFKIAKHTVPISIFRLYKLNSDVHNYNSRQAHHIHSFKGNNEFIYRTFKFQSIYVWNSILQNNNINVYFPTFNNDERKIRKINIYILIICITHVCVCVYFT